MTARPLLPPRADVTVSVIIPTRNSASSIGRCLASVGASRHVSTETIVVDQSSTDGTDEIARAAGAMVVSLPQPGLYTPPTRSRNEGARVARGRYLLHLDADMELLPGTLEACVNRCESANHVALVIHEMDRVSGFWATSKALERRCYWRAAHIEGARFVRAETFWAAGGYDELVGSGEDWDIHRRYALLGDVGYAPVALVHNLGSISFRRQIAKKFAYGRSSEHFLRSGNTAPIVGSMWQAYWRRRGLLTRHSIYAIGFVVLRLGEVAALAAGLGVEAATSRPCRTTALAGVGSRRQTT